MPHKVGNGAIIGIASEEGAPSQKRIILMDRTNMKVLKVVTSDEYGAYTFNGLNDDTSDYLLFAVDDDGIEKKQPIIYDYVQPIPAHQGGFFWSNWYYLATKKEAVVAFMANTDNLDPLSYDFSYGIGAGPAETSGGSAITNKETGTPAAPNIPMLDMISNSIAKYALKHEGSYKFSTERKAFSCEWVLDVATVGNNAGIFLYSGESGFKDNRVDAYYGRKYGGTLINVQYIKAQNAIRLYRHNGNAVTNHQSTMSDGLVLCSSYTLPLELRDKVIHIACSIEYGVVSAIYVNGVSVVSTILSGTNASAGGHADQASLIAVMGSATIAQYQTHPTYTAASYSYELVSFYDEAMSEAEALEHYQALFIDTTPLVTGYLKSVISHYATYFFRLDEPDSEPKIKDALRPLVKEGNNSTLDRILPMQMSHEPSGAIIRGGSGMVFNGGALRSMNTPFSLTSQRFLSLDFVAKPATSGYIGEGVLLRAADKNNLPFLEVVVNGTTKKLTIKWREGNNLISHTFPSEISFDAINHYAITLNKISQELCLYTNGLLTETVTVTTLPIMYPMQVVRDNYIFSIGGQAAASDTSVSRPYYGYLAEVACYPFALSAQKVKAHYESRLII